MPTLTPFLMFENRLDEAVAFYTSTFPDSRVVALSRTGTDGPISSAEFIVAGQRFLAYAGGPHFQFSDAFSMFLLCDDQAEVDLYWDKLVAAGSTPVQCGWITDPWGVSWQIVPRRFMELISGSDPRKVQAVMGAMMGMIKLDVAALERAHDGI